MVTRPLLGEPLALDLLNTWWVDGGHPVDALDEPGATDDWMCLHGFTETAPAAEGPLRQVRDVLRELLDNPGPGSERALNEILERGRVRHALRDAVPVEESDIAAPWLPAWRVAVNYLDLLRENGKRIRRCANPVCTLYFFDTSRNGSRRWCSMEACGNRSKASRHYARTRTTG